MTPGWAVRLLSRLATRIATTTERSLRELPAGKAQAVGYPVRERVLVGRPRAKRASARPAARRAGAAGHAAPARARAASTVAVAEQLDCLLDVCHVLHLTGRADEAELRAGATRCPRRCASATTCSAYLDDMAGAMAAADLAVMRSGASVLGELPAAGLPAILVPGVYEGGHNQRDNAPLPGRAGRGGRRWRTNSSTS